MQGGHLHTGNMTLAPGGNGQFDHVNGEVVIDGTLFLTVGGMGSPTATYMLRDGSLTDASVEIGENGDSSFIQPGGVHNCGGRMKIFRYGEYAISGGQVTAEALHVEHGRFLVDGDQATIGFGEVTMEEAELVTSISAEGVSLIEVAGAAELNCDWIVQADGERSGRWDVLAAGDGLELNFTAITLPGDDWFWGTDADAVLWVARGAAPGDVNADSHVNVDDFTILKAHFGGLAGRGQGDLDGDGVVGMDDFVILKQNFGATAVPEPATLALLALGSMAAIRRRR